MIIDAHNHPDWHGHDLAAFIRNMDDNQIDVTWLLTWICPAGEWDPKYGWAHSCMYENGPFPFERALHYKESYPNRFVLGYCPDPRKPDAIMRLRAAVAIYGIQLCGELKIRMMYDNPDAIRLFRTCGELRLPVTVHLDYEFDRPDNAPWPNFWYGGGIDAFERAIRACPETVFLGHAPGFWAHISGDDQYDKVSYPPGKVQPGGRLIDLLERYSNLYCDISANSGRNALMRDPEHAKIFLETYQDRILYARDYFDRVHREFLDSMGLSPTILEKIYCGNALKLVPLNSRGTA